jgi:two-component system OmpR family sensor kinase
VTARTTPAHDGVDVPVPEPEPAEPPAGGVVGRARDVWARTPLLARLVGITTALLAMGLAIAGTATTTLLSTYLVQQVDERLGTSAANYRDWLGQQYTATKDISLSNYFVGSQDFAMSASIFGSDAVVRPSPEVVEKYGRPHLPQDVTLDDVPSMAREAFTVTSSERGSAWRVTVLPVRDQATTTVGWVMYAEPLGEVQNIVHRASLLLWSSALAILVIGVVVGTWAVNRSLRGLREIEVTAAQIADGDLSQRVPPAPETTEVGRLGAALNSMLAQIEAAFDARTRSEDRMRRFVADASHELRTPLAAIRGYGELYRMGALTEKDQVDDTMRRIEQSATRMGGLVEDLLALARLDEDRPGRTTPVDLAVLATDAAHDLRAIDPTRQVRVGALDGAAATGEDELPATVVRGDEARLRQVLANLVGNVARHTPAGTPAEIAVGRQGDHVVVEVRDHGPGIAPEHARRVFERFYRVDASRTREGNGTGGGAGLGMAIVAAIVDAHRGDVAISPTPGGGATVRVSLPAGDAEPSDDPQDHPDR